MNKNKTFKAWINPLAFLEVDEPWATHAPSAINTETVLKYACTPDITSGVDGIIKRYKEISKEEKRLFAAPAEDHILEKLVWPLKHAKSCYMFGNYLGTISLCGMVAEMVAMLLFEISDFMINNKVLDEEGQKGLFGSTFEKLSQDRRSEILHTYNLIDDELKSAFDTIIGAFFNKNYGFQR